MSTSERAPLLRRDVQAEQDAPLLPASAVAPEEETHLHTLKHDPDAGIANRWARFRRAYKEELAEFLGCFFLIIFGNGVDCQVVLHGAGSGMLSINFAWAIGVAAGVWVSGGVSGGHINPAVTITLAVFRGFPWKRVPSYIIAQVLGCFTAALVIYANYHYSIDLYEGTGIRTTVGERATGGLFFTVPLPFLPASSCFISELLGTAVLVAVVMALGDKNNLAPPQGTSPIALFFLILGIGAALGINTAYGLNPARDFGPRLMASLVGYGSEVWTFRYHYWLWNGWLTTIIGGLVGATVYDGLIYSGTDSPFNRPSRKSYASHSHA